MKIFLEYFDSDVLVPPPVKYKKRGKGDPEQKIHIDEQYFLIYENFNIRRYNLIRKMLNYMPHI